MSKPPPKGVAERISWPGRQYADELHGLLLRAGKFSEWQESSPADGWSQPRNQE
jgi:hypothetical protein